MNKVIKYLIGLKVALIGAAGGYYYYAQKNKPVEMSAKKNDDANLNDASDVGDFAVPNLPKGNLTVSDAVRVRDELEILRKDVVTKIAKLGEAKQSYDTAKVDVEAKLKTIQDERRVLDETLQKEKTVQADRLKEALEFIGKMEPKKAAAVMETSDRDLVLQLLRKLPQRQVTKILEALPARKAAEYMEYYTKIRSGREYELMKELGLCNNPTQQETDTQKAPLQPVANNPAPTAPVAANAAAPTAASAPATSPQAAAAAAVPNATPPAATTAPVAKVPATQNAPQAK